MTEEKKKVILQEVERILDGIPEEFDTYRIKICESFTNEVTVDYKVSRLVVEE